MVLCDQLYRHNSAGLIAYQMRAGLGISRRNI